MILTLVRHQRLPKIDVDGNGDGDGAGTVRVSIESIELVTVLL